MAAQKRQSAFSKALREAQLQPPPSITSESPPAGAPLQAEEKTSLQGQVQEPPSSSSAQASLPIERDTRLHGKEVVLSHGVSAQKGFEKTTFYTTQEHLEKLDDLAHDYRKRTGKRINRNDIVRYLIDQCTLEALFSDGKGVI